MSWGSKEVYGNGPSKERTMLPADYEAARAKVAISDAYGSDEGLSTHELQLLPPVVEWGPNNDLKRFEVAEIEHIYGD